MSVKVLGICGREGAGKTTVANMLTGGPTPYELRKIQAPLLYAASIIYGVDYDSLSPAMRTPDPIWGLTLKEVIRKLSDLMKEHIGLEWFDMSLNLDSTLAPFDVEEDSIDVLSTRPWKEFSLATPLKKICSVLFGFSYETLLAQTPEARKTREEIHTITYSVCGSLTGRYCLEYFGTDVMRKHFDEDIWLKIMRRDADRAIASGGRVVIPDVRFANEGQMINDMNGTLMVIYRNSDDLNITDADRQTHPAKWHFLTFWEDAKNLISLENNISLEELETQLKMFE